MNNDFLFPKPGQTFRLKRRFIQTFPLVQNAVRGRLIILQAFVGLLEKCTNRRPDSFQALWPAPFHFISPSDRYCPFQKFIRPTERRAAPSLRNLPYKI